mmetsp:Transcript_11149/g.20172  ORF Transcript_11149/g.20172 Transcript_11149/m.20172 type:complete len:535 (-) Transcript_11149:235-1839(-)
MMRHRQTSADTSNGIPAPRPTLLTGEKEQPQPDHHGRRRREDSIWISFIIPLFGVLAVTFTLVSFMLKNDSRTSVTDRAVNSISQYFNASTASTSEIPDAASTDAEENLPHYLKRVEKQSGDRQGAPKILDPAATAGEEDLPPFLEAVNFTESPEDSITDSAVFAVGNETYSGTLQNRTSDPPRIPRRLIFTHNYNLLNPSKTDGDPPFNAKDPLTANILHTIETYQKFWNVSDAKAKMTEKEETAEVVFLTDADCIKAVHKAEPRLVKIFSHEMNGRFKADICRAAYLYLHGGYFFDTDVGVIKPVNFDALDIPAEVPNVVGELRLKGEKLNNPRIIPEEDDIVTFSTVYDKQGQFHQAFTAAMPGHPVMKRSLEYMVAFYEENFGQVLPQRIIQDLLKAHDNFIPSITNSEGMALGSYTLYVALRATSHEEWEEYVRGLMKDHGYTSAHESKKSHGDIVAKRRYARYLYEISLDDEEVTRLGLWADVPRQGSGFVRKRSICNNVCFAGRQVYFYSRVPDSRPGPCPIEPEFV